MNTNKKDMTMETKNPRNAGRKPFSPGTKRVVFTTTLPPELIKKLRGFGNVKSAVVEAALNKFFEDT